MCKGFVSHIPKNYIDLYQIVKGVRVPVALGKVDQFVTSSNPLNNNPLPYTAGADSQCY